MNDVDYTLLGRRIELLQDGQHKMRAEINTLTNRVIAVEGRLNGLDTRIGELAFTLSARLDKLEEHFETRFDKLEQRLDALESLLREALDR